MRESESPQRSRLSDSSTHLRAEIHFPQELSPHLCPPAANWGVRSSVRLSFGSASLFNWFLPITGAPVSIRVHRMLEASHRKSRLWGKAGNRQGFVHNSNCSPNSTETG